jgi:hypothetical protein
VEERKKRLTNGGTFVVAQRQLAKKSAGDRCAFALDSLD